LAGTSHAESSPRAYLDVALVSHGLWLRRFGGSPGVIGQRIVLNGQPFTGIGVMPPGFGFHDSSEVWVPLSLPGFFSGAVAFLFLARVAPGLTLGDLRAELVTRWMQRPGAMAAERDRLQVRRLQDALVASVRPRLLLAAGRSSNRPSATALGSRAPGQLPVVRFSPRGFVGVFAIDKASGDPKIGNII
jgi:hypothetical protein